MLQDTPEAPWLLLLHQVPARPSSLRVRVWRRLQAIGAVPLRNAAYVLPNRRESREDLAWVAADVRALGGQASVLACLPLAEADEHELESGFRAARAEEYAGLARAAQRLLASATRGRPRPGELARAEARLRREWDRLARITFFDPPQRKEAREMLERLKRRLQPERPSPSVRATLSGRSRAALRGRTWVTRPRPGIDRMASAWLIRTFVDARARFAFAERPPKGAIPFDMYEGELSHQGGACTFEVIAGRFGLADPAVAWLGRVVHDVDLRDERYGEPEAAGIALAVAGLRERHENDAELLEAGVALFASLASGRAAASSRGPGRRRRTHRGRGRARAG